MKRLAVLGSTGSIGVSTLEVVAAHRERFDIIALAAGRNIALLKEQIERFQPQIAVVKDERTRDELQASLGHRPGLDILTGEEGYFIAAAATGTDMVVSAMVGAAGLLPTLAAVEAGKDIALANKEVLVMAGAQVMEAARRRGVRILPVDSEHSAVFQCLEGRRPEMVRRIILTASGGPFRTKHIEELSTVT
ncbi:MAG: 1-deoxy-D-xylulose-5-phosphate reductoisomerase, partial [Syntrophales bacterium]|nr:1-deoxy-D-xylulose-5-phosphate reductoisomerase [Syntrophales bacterium]